MYDYKEAVADDIRNITLYEIKDDWDAMSFEEWKEQRDDIAEQLYEDLWVDDHITGNGSGSYTFDREKAKEYVLDGYQDVKEALKEFDVPAEEVADKFLSEDWEYLDVTARCYVLYAAIDEVLDEYEQNREAAE